jgi:hypothetical protein
MTTSRLVMISLLILAPALIHPFGAVSPGNTERPLLAEASIDSQTAALVIRSCQDCHSERTAWPWYSHVPPASWIVERDVNRARRSMNLSRWEEYSAEQREQLLAGIGAVIRNRQMPPQPFLLLHHEARLSPEERNRIYEWAHMERRRVRAGRTR